MCEIVYDPLVSDAIVKLASEFDEFENLTLTTLEEFLERKSCRYDPKTGSLVFEENVQFDVNMVMDRVIEVSNKSLENIDNNDNVISKGQVYQAYTKLLELNTDDNCQYSTAGYLLPLNSQWQIIKANGIPVDTPNYLHGYGPEIIDISSLKHPIFKSPFDYYRWKPNDRPEGLAIDEFVVEKPAGVPVLSYFLGDQISDPVVLNSAENISSESSLKIAKISLKIKELFLFEVGEILWYVDADNITFAALSPFLNGASNQNGFRQSVKSYLEGYFGNSLRDVNA